MSAADEGKPASVLHVIAANMTAHSTLPLQHGATVLPAVEVNSYNLELKEDDEFIGDRASK
jgi:hypothetical protein